MPADAPDIDDDTLLMWASAIDGLELPLADDEAIALLALLPPDDGTVFGLAWSLLHAVETAPYGPLFIRSLDDRSWSRSSSRSGRSEAESKCPARNCRYSAHLEIRDPHITLTNQRTDRAPSFSRALKREAI